MLRISRLTTGLATVQAPDIFKRVWRALRSYLRKPRMAVYCGNGRVLFRTQRGQKMFADASDLSLTPHLILDGTWEQWVTKEMLRHVQRGMTVVEVGANVGYHTLYLAHAIGPKGRLLAFEANSSLAQITNDNLAINGFHERARCLAQAASDRAGPATFYIAKRELGGSTLIDQSSEEYEKREVSATTLDAALQSYGAVDFLKIDAEGAELKVLRGASDVIARSPRLKMILECNPQHEGLELIDFLEGHGFRLHIIDHTRGVLALPPRDRLSRMGAMDLLATRA